FAQRVRRTDEQARCAAGEVQRVGRVDDDLAGQLSGGIAHDLFGRSAVQREDDDVCPPGYLIGLTCCELGKLRLAAVAGADADLMTMARPATSQRLPNRAAAENRNLHSGPERCAARACSSGADDGSCA